MPLAEDSPQSHSETPPRDLPPLPNDPLDFASKDAPSVHFPLLILLSRSISPASKLTRVMTVALLISMKPVMVREFPLVWILVTPPNLFPY